MDLKTEKIRINTKELLDKIMLFMRKGSGWALSLIFVLAVGYSVYLWYIYAFNPNWSDVKKQEYINTKQREVSFDEGKFDSAVNEIKQKKADYQKNLNNIPDIFQFK